MFTICGIFFLSGFSALIYQLLWFRQLGFIFGNTVFAATTVLTAFMGGLALGAHLFGKAVHRAKSPVRWFAWLEFGIGLYALAVPWMFGLVQGFYRWVYQNVSDSIWVLTPVWFLLAIVVMFLPTVLMGATLPVLAQGLTRRDRHFASRISLLYGVNTFGAVGGLVAAGFLLIPAIGLWRTNLIAVGSDLLVGAIAWWLATRLPAAPPSDGTDIEPSDEGSAWRVARTLLLASGVSGFLALAFEVVWFRALIMIYGSTTYSFVVMLAVFLAGIALGSMMLGWLSDRFDKRLDLIMALSFLVIGTWTLLSMYRFNGSAEFLLRYLVRHGMAWGTLIQAKVWITLAFLFVPTLCFGFAFTVVAKAVRGAENTSGRAVAEVYTVNTIGAVLGSLAGGFILLPLLGIQNALFFLSALALVVSAVLALRSTQPKAVRIAVSGTAMLILVLTTLWTPYISKRVLAVGAYFSPWQFIAGDRILFWEKVKSEHLLYYREGLTSTISVAVTPDQQMFFSSSGKVQADSGDRSMALQRMQGHLPMLLHPNPRKVVNIGLGAGVTFGALSCYPLDHLEVVDIESNVREVAEIWGERNHHIMRNPKAQVTIADGRNHLFCTTNRYDVITSDPFEPVHSGAGHLYTVNHFKQARAVLNEGGLMGQFLPMYEMSRDDFFVIMRSFAEAFPNSALFFTGTDTVMVGFKDEIAFDADSVRAKFEIPEVAASLAEIGIETPELVLGMFVADLSELLRREPDGLLNTDDRPIIEFRTPKSALAYMVDSNAQVLVDYFTPIPDAWLAGYDESERETIRNAQGALRLALEALVLRARERGGEAFAKLLEAERLAPGQRIIATESIVSLLMSAGQLMSQGHAEQAAIQYHMALQRNPREFAAMERLFFLHMRAGRTGPAMQLLEHAQHVYPQAATFEALRGRVAMSHEDWAGARSHTEQALEWEPWRVDLRAQMIEILTKLGDDAGIEQQEAAIRALDPRVSHRRRF